MSNQAGQSRELLRQYLAAREVAPWIAVNSEDEARYRLHTLGGLANSWRTDVSTCLYHIPQLVGGGLVDLSATEAMHRYNEAMP